MPGAVLVVELRLGDRVVDVDRREGQLPGGGELVEAQNAGRGLLGDAPDRLGDGAPLVLVGLEPFTQQVQENLIRPNRSRRRGTAGLLELRPRSTSMVASPPSSRIMFAGSPGQVSICSAATSTLEVSPFQAKTGVPWAPPGFRTGRRPRRPPRDLSGRCCSSPPNFGTERNQRLDRGPRSGRSCAASRRSVRRQSGNTSRVFAAKCHQAGHLVLGRAGSLCGRTRPLPGRQPCSRCRCACQQ